MSYNTSTGEATDDVSVFTPAIEAEIQKAIDRRRLEFYQPYPKQLDFHATGLIPNIRERLLIAGNQCLGPWTPIEMLGKTRRIGEWLGEARFAVRSWDGGSRCVAQAEHVFLKGIEPAFRVYLDNGDFFDCSRRHRVLTRAGWLSLAQLVRASSGLRCSREVRDYSANYATDDRLCDAPLQWDLDNGRESLQERDDAQTRNHLDERRDAGGNKFQYSRAHQSGAHRPILDDPNQIAALCAQSADPSVHIHAQWPSTTRQALRRSALECGRRRAGAAQRSGLLSTDVAPAEVRESFAVEETLAPDGERARAPQQSAVWCDPGQVTLESLATARHTEIFVPYQTPGLIGGQRIESIIPIGSQSILDFTVPQTHCYEVGGVIHHNTGKTWSAGAEAAIYTTGMYPSWWNGRRWNGPTNGWVGSPTGQTLREGPQRILLGEVGEWGSGMIPGRSILDIRKAVHGSSDQVESIIIRHEPTKKISRLLLKTYDQGRIRWQGATINYVWFDEEPPEEVYDEGRTRTIVLDGFVFMTFTPLLGMTEVVGRYLIEKPKGSVVVKMGIADALHFSPERQAEILAGYKDYERDARAYGEPIMGSGRVFPIDPAEITESPIQIPDYWPRLAGLDIGWDHPTAVVWVAWDRDVDVVHVYDTYRMKEQTPLVHSAIIKKRGPWIPVAWPHDGHQHDKGSGKNIAQHYRNEGVLMLSAHATHPPEKGQREGTGGYSLEAGVSDMLVRMQTGRWKVSSLCQDWFDEYRMYYRKDGQIVKKGDDLMSASRVANMMLRFAKVRVVRQTSPRLPGFQQSDPGMGVLG